MRETTRILTPSNPLPGLNNGKRETLIYELLTLIATSYSQPRPAMATYGQLAVYSGYSKTGLLRALTRLIKAGAMGYQYQTVSDRLGYCYHLPHQTLTITSPARRYRVISYLTPPQHHPQHPAPALLPPAPVRGRPAQLLEHLRTKATAGHIATSPALTALATGLPPATANLLLEHLEATGHLNPVTTGGPLPFENGALTLYKLTSPLPEPRTSPNPAQPRLQGLYPVIETTTYPLALPSGPLLEPRALARAKAADLFAITAPPVLRAADQKQAAPAPRRAPNQPPTPALPSSTGERSPRTSPTPQKKGPEEG